MSTDGSLPGDLAAPETLNREQLIERCKWLEQVVDLLSIDRNKQAARAASFAAELSRLREGTP